jgi:pimeloyl-ACP methyl ester carboxylesterase
MAAALPHARLHVVEGAGHAVQLERPDAVAAAIG